MIDWRKFKETILTDRTNQKRKRKNISIGDLAYAKLPKQIPKQKLDYPVSGPFQVMAKRGNTITIKEEETQKKYQVQPDTLILKNNSPTGDADQSERESRTHQLIIMSITGSILTILITQMWYL